MERLREQQVLMVLILSMKRAELEVVVVAPTILAQVEWVEMEASQEQVLVVAEAAHP